MGVVTDSRPETMMGAVNTLLQEDASNGECEDCKKAFCAVAGQSITTSVWERVILSRTTIVILKSQPPEMLPESSEASSTTNRFQVPVGSVPLNTDKEATK